MEDNFSTNKSLLMGLKEKPDTPIEVKVLAVIVKELLEVVEILSEGRGLTGEEVEKLRKTYNK